MTQSSSKPTPVGENAPLLGTCVLCGRPVMLGHDWVSVDGRLHHATGCRYVDLDAMQAPPPDRTAES